MGERATRAADAKQAGARARGVRCWAAARGEGNLGRWLGTSGPNWLGGIGLRGRKGGGPSVLDRLGAGFRPSRVWETGFVFLYTSLF